MSNGHSLLKAFSTIGVALTLGVSMSACGGSEKWKEEVQLGDGRIIVVERETLREGGGDEWAFNRSGSKPKEYRIRFTHPDKPAQIIEWRSTKTDDRFWPELPLILDASAGQPIVFALVAVSIGCKVYSKYIYQNGAWAEDPLPEQFEQRTTNLFLKLGVDMPSYVNIETKRGINSSSDYRQSLKQVGPTRKVCG